MAGRESTHRFDWSSTRILYQSVQGCREPDGEEIARWAFEPVDATRRVSQHPMPVHLNLWLFKGQPPKDGKEVEIVIRSFRFDP